MDTRQIFPTLLVCFALFFAHQYFTAPKGPPPGAAGPAFPAPVAAQRAAEQGAAPMSVTLGDPRGNTDKLSIVVNNITAGIDEVDLNYHQYAQTVDSKDPYKLLAATPN